MPNLTIQVSKKVYVELINLASAYLEHLKSHLDTAALALPAAEAADEDKALTDPKAPICAIHQVAMVRMRSKKDGTYFWSCHEKTDGKFCTYRPPTP